MNTITIPAN